MRGKIESALINQGRLIAGVDEVGRGCIAGPVYASCCLVDYKAIKRLEASDLALIRDSKTLSFNQRIKALDVIEKISLNYSIKSASTRQVEKLGIVGAIFHAMKLALKEVQLYHSLDLLLVDGNKEIPKISLPQKTVIKGDNLCYSIASASILAKVARDRYMIKMAKTYPNYGFDEHMGYGTKKHRDQLKKLGYCPLHRRNFAPVSTMIADKASDFESLLST